MSPEKQEELYRRYPDLFAQTKLTIRESCMPWGIQHGDGWFAILDELCTQLTMLQRATRLSVEFSTLKEKFGGLRAYTDIRAFPEGADDAEKQHWSRIVWALVADAERRSTQTCEETGEYGETCIRSGWYKTLSTAKAEEMGFITLEQWQSRQEETAKEAPHGF